MWVPERARRSIRDIALHVGACKLMYDDYAFGDGTLRWEDLPPLSGPGPESLEGMLRSLQEAQAKLRRSVATLDDAELLRLRMTNWGELKPIRWIAAVMTQHDLYHAGEINYLRSLHQQNDRWEWEEEG